MQAHNVEFTHLDLGPNQEMSNTLYRTCSFCDKVVMGSPQIFDSCLSISSTFYCAFCLRHKFHLPSSKKVLQLSFKNIIAYYYCVFYMSRPSSISFYELRNMIREHVQTGLREPAFAYDPTHYLWCIDFNLIGEETGLIPLENILRRASNILLVFDLKNRLGKKAQITANEDLHTAIDQFQKSKNFDNKLFMPRLDVEKPEKFEEITKKFNKYRFVVK